MFKTVVYCVLCLRDLKIEGGEFRGGISIMQFMSAKQVYEQLISELPC